VLRALLTSYHALIIIIIIIIIVTVQFSTDGLSRVGPLGYSRMGEGSCAGYNRHQRSQFFDSNMTVVFYAAVVALALTASVMAIMIASSCIAVPQWTLKCAATLSFLSSILQGLQFLLYQSKLTEEPYGGRFFFGAITVIAAMLVANATACFIWLVPSPYRASTVSLASPPRSSLPTVSDNATPPPPSHKRNFSGPRKGRTLPETAPDMAAETSGKEAFAPGTETVTETLLPDGSKKVTTTKVGLDGSKSVTETVVHTQTKSQQS
jgi:hypothetical protein